GVAVDRRKGNLKEGGGAGVGVLSKVEGAIMAAVEKGAKNQNSIDTVRDEAAEALDPTQAKLENLGLLVDDSDRLARVIPLIVTLLVVPFGVIKIFVGLERHKPASYLVVLFLISVIAALISFFRPAFPSR